MYILKGTIYSNKCYNINSMKFRKDTQEQVYVFFLIILLINSQVGVRNGK